MRILSLILEIITSPFTVLIRSNVNIVNRTTLVKSILTLFIAILVVTVLVLFYYREYIFK